MFIVNMMGVLSAARSRYVGKICLLMARSHWRSHHGTSIFERPCSRDSNLSLAIMLIAVMDLFPHGLERRYFRPI